MRRFRGRSRLGAAVGSVRGRGPSATAPTRVAGFGEDSSSSSSSEGGGGGPEQDGPFQDGPSSVKRPRMSESRIFLPTPIAGQFLEQLKQHDDDVVPSRMDILQQANAGLKGSFDAGDPTTTNIFVGNLVRIPLFFTLLFRKSSPTFL